MTTVHRTTSDFFAIASLLVLAAFGCVPTFSWQTTSKQPQSTIRLRDDSDWWSITKGYGLGNSAKVQHRELAPGSFQIIGIELEDELLAIAMGKLGPATTVERGDAGEWRSQLCYLPAGESTNTYLIFETGEIDRAFYLFNGPGWTGSNKCTATNLVAGRLATGTDLHLGESPSQVMAILGKPSGERKGGMTSLVESRKNNSPEELKKLGKRFPQMSEQDFARTLRPPISRPRSF